MRINDISITDLHRTADGQRLLGDVTFSTTANEGGNPSKVVISCDVAYNHKVRADAILIGEAIRQLRRLPDIRSGVDRLFFDPGLRPLATTRPMDRKVSNG